MPLSQNDPSLDYDGSWGVASKDWPKICFSTEKEAERVFYFVTREKLVPYGSYVLSGVELRLETPELKKLVEERWEAKGKDEVLVAAVVARPATSSSLRPSPNCWACENSYMEPDSPLICGHPDSGTFGKSLTRGRPEHCGEFTKFKQHPLRNPDGSLKGR